MLNNSIFTLLFIITLLLTFTNGLSIDLSKKDKIEQDNKFDDDFYLIYVDNTKKAKHNKRQETSEFIDELVNEIHNLIVNNVDTYKDPEILQELNEEDTRLKKRDSEVRYLVDYGDSSYVYPISTTETKTVLYAYLSNSLIPIIKSKPEIIDVVANEKYEEHTVYNIDDIKDETHWDDVAVRENAPLHLSIISQGEYNETRVGKYDKNYYYPKSAGEDIDLFILDVGFNFNHPEFSNKNERNIKCLFNITRAKVIESNSDIYCFGQTLSNHGTKVAECAAGKNHGVANKANIYAVLLDGIESGNVISALEYIKKHFYRPHKAIFNLSYGSIRPINRTTPASENTQRVNELFEELVDDGALVFTSAGNEGELSYNVTYNQQSLPCLYNYTICVGGINNVEQKYFNTHVKYSDVVTYEVDKDSNYGYGVDIYAPFNVFVKYQSHDTSKNKEEIARGTSFSSPIAAGIAATILSDHPDIEFNKTSMLNYLYKIGQKGIIRGLPEGVPNVLINNGKHIVYSKNDKYYGCGILAGNQKCSNNQCCSKNGYCGTDSEFCSHGCQSEFGVCH
ncbi:carbohydrate-binding module family 18 protein [Piromyces sp. E2]|nr:carbohydrate-binding module family 18 protein [Piromyces sp. E2]|eukprot:OUM65181.1 carbohydrate-binding module family 18 protein [Piromyces sp. E2]